MDDQGQKIYWRWYGFYFVGLSLVCVTIIFVGMKLPNKFQPVFALSLSALCFGTAFFCHRVSNSLSDTERRRAFLFLSVIGATEIVIALWLEVFPPTSRYAEYARLANVELSAIIGFITCRELFHRILPRGSIILANPPPPAPNPLLKFSPEIQRAIGKGVRIAYGPSVLLVVVAFIMGTIVGPLMFKTDTNKATSFFLESIVFGGIAAVIWSKITKAWWRKWAARQGLPINELHAAAKVVGLGWSKEM